MPYISLPSRFSAFRRIIWIIRLVGVLIVFGSLYLVHGGLKPNVQPPPPSAPYLGTDKAPPGLPAPSPLFVEDDSAADQAPAYSGPFPPEPLDADKTAAEAAQMLTNSKPNIDAASSGGSASPANIGLLVCSPVPTTNSSPDIRNFAVGCSDWLQLIAAGQPELGRTALLESRGRLEYDLHRSDLCLSPDEAEELVNKSGANDIVCGTISGTNDKCSLTYQIYAVPGKAPIGSAITVTGSSSDVIAALPKLAATIDNRLGVTSPAVPSSVGVTPSDLAWMGNLYNVGDFSDSDLLTLKQLASKCPLAGLWLLPSSENDVFLERWTVKTLMTQLSNNPLVLASIDYEDTDAMRPFSQHCLDLYKKYPLNALIAHVQVWNQRSWGSRIPELAASERLTQDSPFDPNSWLSMAQTLQNIADDVREGRTIADISQKNMDLLDQLYEIAENDTVQATNLDPLYGHAWYEEANAATFASDQHTAYDSMDKAVQLDDNTSEVYSWGLELYQPKWFSDSARLSGIAEKATSATYDTANDADDVADELDNVAQALPDPEYKTMADVVRANAVSAFRAVVAKNPDDGAKHWGLAYALAASDDPSDLREATKEYRIALHFLPNSAALHYELSEVLRRRGKSALQVAELQRAVRLYPSYLEAVLQLGYTLKHETRFSEALPDLLLASRLAPADADTHNALGDLYSLKHEKNLSLTEYSEALKYSIYDVEAWSSLVYELDEAGRYQDSIDAATNALYYFSEIEPSDTLDVSDVYLNISDDYLHLKQWNKSLAASHKSLALNSAETMSQENIAEAEWGKGDSAGAKSQWKFVVSLHDPQVSPIAAKMLAEHS